MGIVLLVVTGDVVLRVHDAHPVHILASYLQHLLVGQFRYILGMETEAGYPNACILKKSYMRCSLLMTLRIY